MDRSPPDAETAALDRWLETATGDLEQQPKARVREEVEAHYRDILQDILLSGKEPTEQQKREALSRLGDPAVAAKGFCDQHPTRALVQWMKRFSAYAVAFGVLGPIFLLVGGGYLTATSSSGLHMFLGAYFGGLLFPGTLLLREFHSSFVAPGFAERVERAKRLRIRVLFFSMGCFLFFLEFFLLRRYVFSSNVGLTLFTVSQGIFYASSLMYGVGLRWRIRKITAASSGYGRSPR